MYNLLSKFALGKSVGTTGAGNTLQANIRTILTGIIGIMGVICIIFVVVGGVQYLTSGGDAAKVEKGKKTILYALIGLIICALAFAIVQFVINSVLKQ